MLKEMDLDILNFNILRKKEHIFFGRLVGYKYNAEDSIFIDIDDFENKLINLYPTLKKNRCRF